MKALALEMRLIVRSRLAVAALALLLLLASLAVASGLREVNRQQATLAHLTELQQHELDARARQYAGGVDPGSAAYYTFHGTWDPPSHAAFLALGLRDASPYVLRVRALALQAQLHEGEAFNPEVALAGRFDYAFVLVYLVPLFVIALLHDLVSGERRAGRLGTLLALPGASGLWLQRAGLRAALVWVCLALPLLAAAAVHGLGGAALATVLGVSAAYVVFWSGVSLFVASRGRSSAANATALMGTWAVLTLVLPSLGSAVLSRAVPVQQGVELMLAQRQAVHGAWDLPPAQTMDRFLATHPEWRDTAPLPDRFHWKWYYAFQQLGDESVAPRVAAYRTSLQARQDWTARLGWLLPGVGAQAALHRLADTDLQAQLAYQDRVAGFHARLREHYYPYLFRERTFAAPDFAAQPRFEAPPAAVDVPVGQLVGLGLAALLAAAAGVAATRRVRP